MTNLIFTIIATNIDSFNVGLSFGLQKIKITIGKILTISLCLALMTFLSLNFGSYLAKWIPEIISRIIGASIFLFFALLSYKETKQRSNTFVKKIAYPEHHDLNHDQKISTKEALLIALTLSMDTFIIALTLTTSYSNSLVSILFGISNFLFLTTGTFIANLPLLKNLTKKIEYLPSILFVVLAFMRLI